MKALKIQLVSIVKNINGVKEVANYIVIGKENVIDYLKDTRISIEFKAKFLTDKDISEVNYSSTTENRIIYIIGVSQNQEELDKVLFHASNVAGVKRIINLVVDKNFTNEKKMSNLKIAFQMDPPSEYLIKREIAPLALMENAIKKRYKVYIYTVDDLILDNNIPLALCSKVKAIDIKKRFY